MRLGNALGLIGAAVVVLACEGPLGQGGDEENVITDETQAYLREPDVARLHREREHGHDCALAASFSTTGPIDEGNAFHTAQGSNGRSCVTCHVAADGWSVRPETVRKLFARTAGKHPIFNLLDANQPNADVSTVAKRRRAYSMLLQGKFSRSRTLPATRDYDLVAVNDPLGVSDTTRLYFFRRPLPTANFRSHTVMWDNANTVGVDLRAGLVRQARGNITSAQQGMAPTDALVNSIVDFELSISHAQLSLPKVGRLDRDGARGGPFLHAQQPLVAGRFDLFDAWRNDRDPDRRRIARGQDIFNAVNPGSGSSCAGCHNAANNGQHVNGVLFDVGVSDPARRRPDMAVFTFQERGTGALRTSTDPGLGLVTGRFRDLNRFKTPNLRGLASRGPYFHNGVAETLMDVVRLYEQSLGFTYTGKERADLVAFMNAL